jgi:membrane-bound metal-dependent hydrolase YbcI (DUF457 family)
MNTPSHFIMTAALDKALPRVPIVRGAVLIGSVAPDLPLWMLSIGGLIYYQYILGWSSAETFRMMFDELYFKHPVWIALHNTLHSPVVLLTGLAVVWRKRRNIGSWQRWWFWFFLACLLHSIVDILTHADDGPLLLFPLNWSIRFNSPVSYWDSRYYGDRFQQFEFILDAILLIYLLKDRVSRLIHKWINIS